MRFEPGWAPHWCRGWGRWKHRRSGEHWRCCTFGIPELRSIYRRGDSALWRPEKTRTETLIRLQTLILKTRAERGLWFWEGNRGVRFRPWWFCLLWFSCCMTGSATWFSERCGGARVVRYRRRMNTASFFWVLRRVWREGTVGMSVGWFSYPAG